MCPVAAQWQRPTPASLETLRLFPFWNNNDVINTLNALQKIDI